MDGKSKVLCQGDNEKYDGPPNFGPPNTADRTHKDNPALHTNVSIFSFEQICSSSSTDCQ